MAYLFDATGEYITGGTVAIPTTGTLVAWARPDWNHTDDTNHFLFDVRTSDANNAFGFGKAWNNSFFAGWKSVGTDWRIYVASGDYTLSSGTGYFFIVTWDDTANETRLYLDGAQIGTRLDNLITWNTNGETRYIGNYWGAALDWRGAIAECAIWPRVLTAGERARFDAGLLPVGGAVGNDWWPMIGDLTNVWGGTNGTASGATVLAHPTSIIHQPAVIQHHKRMMAA